MVYSKRYSLLSIKIIGKKVIDYYSCLAPRQQDKMQETYLNWYHFFVAFFRMVTLRQQSNIGPFS